MDFHSAFHDIDTDGSGEITKEELVVYMNKKKYAPQFVEKWLRLFDADGDGLITYEEYCDTLGLRPKPDALTKIHQYKKQKESESQAMASTTSTIAEISGQTSMTETSRTIITTETITTTTEKSVLSGSTSTHHNTEGNESEMASPKGSTMVTETIVTTSDNNNNEKSTAGGDIVHSEVVTTGTIIEGSQQDHRTVVTGGDSLKSEIVTTGKIECSQEDLIVMQTTSSKTESSRTTVTVGDGDQEDCIQQDVSVKTRSAKNMENADECNNNAETGDMDNAVVETTTITKQRTISQKDVNEEENTAIAQAATSIHSTTISPATQEVISSTEKEKQGGVTESYKMEVDESVPTFHNIISDDSFELINASDCSRKSSREDKVNVTSSISSVTSMEVERQSVNIDTNVAKEQKSSRKSSKEDQTVISEQVATIGTDVAKVLKNSRKSSKEDSSEVIIQKTADFSTATIPATSVTTMEIQKQSVNVDTNVAKERKSSRKSSKEDQTIISEQVVTIDTHVAKVRKNSRKSSKENSSEDILQKTVDLPTANIPATSVTTMEIQKQSVNVDTNVAKERKSSRKSSKEDQTVVSEQVVTIDNNVAKVRKNSRKSSKEDSSEVIHQKSADLPTATISATSVTTMEIQKQSVNVDTNGAKERKSSRKSSKEDHTVVREQVVTIDSDVAKVSKNSRKSSKEDSSKDILQETAGQPIAAISTTSASTMDVQKQSVNVDSNVAKVRKSSRKSSKEDMTEAVVQKTADVPTIPTTSTVTAMKVPTTCQSTTEKVQTRDNSSTLQSTITNSSTTTTKTSKSISKVADENQKSTTNRQYAAPGTDKTVMTKVTKQQVKSNVVPKPKSTVQKEKTVSKTNSTTTKRKATQAHNKSKRSKKTAQPTDDQETPASRYPKHYEDQVKPGRKQCRSRRKGNFKDLRPSVMPGRVVILLAGRHRGKRVIVLKRLEQSGLLLVTGPFKYNGVGMRRVNANMVIGTSTQICASIHEDSTVNGTLQEHHVDDEFFARHEQCKRRRGGGKSHSSEIYAKNGDGLKYEITEEKCIAQSEVDKVVIQLIRQHPEREMLKQYLKSTFKLYQHDAPHKLLF